VRTSRDEESKVLWRSVRRRRRRNTTRERGKTESVLCLREEEASHDDDDDEVDDDPGAPYVTLCYGSRVKTRRKGWVVVLAVCGST
jgi:hypothetical protein